MSDSCADMWGTSSSHESSAAAVAAIAAVSAALGSMATVWAMRRRGRGDGGEEKLQNDNECPRCCRERREMKDADFLESLATAATGITTLNSSKDYLPQDLDGDDQVGPLKEIYSPRGGTMRQTRDARENRAGMSHPEPVALPPRHRRGRRRSSLYGRRCSSITSKESIHDDTSLHESDISTRRLSRDEDMQHVHFFVEEENYIGETEMKFKGQQSFDETVVAAAGDFEDTLSLLRRTKAISALAHRLMAAPDEAACLEEVTRLLVLMFGLRRASFAMLTGSDHFLLKRVNVKRRSLMGKFPSSFDLECLDSDMKRPLAGTAAGECVRTLREHYTPRTQHSPFDTHKVFYGQGLNTVLVTPILVNGGKCTGCILLSKEEEDAFKKTDRVLIADIGLLLGANIYAKRLLKAAEESKKRSREMLHSFIPPKILDKIECYWDKTSEESKFRRSVSSADNSLVGSTGSNDSDRMARSNSWFVAQSNWTDAEVGKKHGHSEGGIKEKLQLIKNMLDDNSDEHVIVSTSGMDFSPTTQALYAENVKNVCIVFTDIVGFSRIAMNLSPTKVMDMLQNLFSRFDELCDLHGVFKLETIGDAYICCTNLMEEDDDDDDDGVNDAAIRALEMAKDMIIETTHVHIPSHSGANAPFETLQIRVGIHVGDVTCGVLGQRLPKFTTCGTAVNMAARMEQASQPSHIRVTKDFHDLVGDAELGWMEKEVLPLKNMGLKETYLLDPLNSR